jgi:hypothetical protein
MVRPVLLDLLNKLLLSSYCIRSSVASFVLRLYLSELGHSWAVGK